MRLAEALISLGICFVHHIVNKLLSLIQVKFEFVNPRFLLRKLHGEVLFVLMLIRNKGVFEVVKLVLLACYSVQQGPVEVVLFCSARACLRW